LKQARAGEQLVQHHAEREHVAAAIDLPAAACSGDMYDTCL